MWSRRGASCDCRPPDFCDISSATLQGEVWARNQWNEPFHAGWLCIVVDSERVTTKGTGHNTEASDWVTLGR
ncbi:MAG: hypothetical protein K0V04_14120 [Deltaproteobacteria bacterium]|nr:hypothetical protein [Deltaproteobacteria bacterium]